MNRAPLVADARVFAESQAYFLHNFWQTRHYARCELLGNYFNVVWVTVDAGAQDVLGGIPFICSCLHRQHGFIGISQLF